MTTFRRELPAKANWIRPVDVKALDAYRIWLRCSDGSAGMVDLSDLVGRGVFAAWNDPRFFKEVRLGQAGAVAWGEDIELCPDALYMQLTGKPLEEVIPGLASQADQDALPDFPQPCRYVRVCRTPFLYEPSPPSGARSSFPSRSTSPLCRSWSSTSRNRRAILGPACLYPKGRAASVTASASSMP